MSTRHKKGHDMTDPAVIEWVTDSLGRIIEQDEDLRNRWRDMLVDTYLNGQGWNVEVVLLDWLAEDCDMTNLDDLVVGLLRELIDPGNQAMAEAITAELISDQERAQVENGGTLTSWNDDTKQLIRDLTAIMVPVHHVVTAARNGDDHALGGQAAAFVVAHGVDAAREVVRFARDLEETRALVIRDVVKYMMGSYGPY